MPEIWMPGIAEVSLDEFVRRVLAQIDRYTSTHGAERSEVRVALADGREFQVKSIQSEPGYGFVTFGIHSEGHVNAEELILPVMAIRSIALGPAEADRARFGFALPDGGTETGPAA